MMLALGPGFWCGSAGARADEAELDPRGHLSAKGRRASVQKIYFSPNWMLRGVVTCEVIWPKLPTVVMSRPGGPKLTWLIALKNSARKSRYCCSLTENFLPMEASKLK